MLAPWKIQLTLSLAGVVTDFSRRSDGTINRQIFKFLDVVRNVPPLTMQGVKVSDVTVDPTKNLWFRHFSPVQETTESTLPVLVFFHGGGFSFLSPDAGEYDAVCRRFSRETPAVVVSVNYRLTPEHRFPAPYDDGFDTLKFLDEKSIADFPANADLTRVFLVGDSAGGNLAHHLARKAAQTNFMKLKVIGLVAVQPFFGGEERTESELQLVGAPLVSVQRTDWHWKVFLPEGADRDHEAANVFGPNSDDISSLKNFPKTLVVVGGLDPLQDWQRRYYQGLKRAGKEVRLIEYPKAFHAFYIFPEAPESSLLFREVIDFINSF